jgi:hypothetical protein
MPVNGFTNALNAMPCSNPCRVTAACIARMARTLARQFKKVATKMGVAVDILIINTASLSKMVLTNNRAGLHPGGFRHLAALAAGRKLAHLARQGSRSACHCLPLCAGDFNVCDHRE